MHDVQLTLLLTIALVILVIFLFLRRVTATIIPALAVPISLIATLGAMYLLNFSIDNISLLGLTLAVGLVVDDAIVMLENIYRHMEEEGLGPFEAALKGSREIGFTIISITVSLVAVFIPVLLMGGIIGRIFNEFAVVVTVAIVASAFVSLTLTPMLAAKILRTPEKDEQQPRWSVLFERGFDAVLRGYDRTLQYSLRHQPLMLVVFFATLLGTAWLLMATPKGFFPQEDIGQLSVSTEARQDISFEAMVALQQQVADAFRRSPHVANVASIVGSTEQARASTPAACSSSSSRATSARRCRRCWPTCGATPPAFPASAPTRRRCRTCASAAARAGPSTSSSCRASIGRSSTSGRRRWRTPWAAIRTSPTSTATCRSTPRRRRLIVDKDKASSLGISARAAALDALFRLRQPAGLHHLRHRRQLLRGDGVHRQDQLDHGRAARRAHPQLRRASWCRSAPSRASSARRARSPSTSSGSFPPSPSRSTCRRACSLGDAVARIEQLKARAEGARRRSPPPSPATPRPSRIRSPTRASC